MDPKMQFFGLFRAKMNTICIQNPKLIVTNYVWSLALFQIYDVKPELMLVKLKVCKNGIFWAKNLFQKRASKWVFIVNICQFQRPLMIGLKNG